MIVVEEVVAGALAKALETMAFIMVFPDEEDMSIPNETVLAEMMFTGPKSGIVQVLSGMELGRLMAQNMGCLFEPSQDDVMDAWQELCNVTCGLVIPEVADSEKDVYDVSVPCVKWGHDAPDWQSFTHESHCDVLNVEGQAVAVRLLLQSE